MSADAVRRFRSTVDQRWVAIGVLVTAQCGDLVSTLYGLRSPDVVELNPVVAAAMSQLGVVTGLLCMAVVAVVTVAVVTEFAVRRYRETALAPGHIRCFGYTPQILLSVAATLNNLAVIGVI